MPAVNEIAVGPSLPAKRRNVGRRGHGPRDRRHAPAAVAFWRECDTSAERRNARAGRSCVLVASDRVGVRSLWGRSPGTERPAGFGVFRSRTPATAASVSGWFHDPVDGAWQSLALVGGQCRLWALTNLPVWKKWQGSLSKRGEVADLQVFSGIVRRTSTTKK
jgi:hypothetical protein